MAFVESPRFPEDISYGFEGGPEFRTTIVETLGGYEQRNQEWAQSRARYDIAQLVKTPAQMYALLKFFRAVAKGRLNSFRFKDWSDFEVLSTEGVMFGDGTPVLQLQKGYVSGSSSHYRDIRKPVSSTVAILRNASPVTEGASPGQISISTTTGLVTFVADDSEAITGHTPGASHQFTTAGDIPLLAVNDKVYINEVTGTAAAVLNALAHTITAKTGTGPYTWTISTDTTGLAVTANGTAYAYPQADETLAWSGQFDVPVRFDIDHLKQNIEAFEIRNWSQIPIIEVRV